jgi:hypothetical protein
LQAAPPWPVRSYLKEPIRVLDRFGSDLVVLEPGYNRPMSIFNGPVPTARSGGWSNHFTPLFNGACTWIELFGNAPIANCIVHLAVMIASAPGDIALVEHPEAIPPKMQKSILAGNARRLYTRL